MATLVASPILGSGFTVVGVVAKKDRMRSFESGARLADRSDGDGLPRVDCPAEILQVGPHLSRAGIAALDIFLQSFAHDALELERSGRIESHRPLWHAVDQRVEKCSSGLSLERQDSSRHLIKTMPKEKRSERESRG